MGEKNKTPARNNSKQPSHNSASNVLVAVELGGKIAWPRAKEQESYGS